MADFDLDDDLSCDPSTTEDESLMGGVRSNSKNNSREIKSNFHEQQPTRLSVSNCETFSTDCDSLLGIDSKNTYSIDENEHNHNENVTCDDTNEEDEDDYVPEGLKSMVAEADANLKAAMSDEILSDKILSEKIEFGLSNSSFSNSRPNLIKSFHGISKFESIKTVLSSSNALESDINIVDEKILDTPMSEGMRSSDDTDLESGSRSNPANHYPTSEEAKRHALGVEPVVCLDDGESHIGSHLQRRVKMNLFSHLEDVKKQGGSFEGSSPHLNPEESDHSSEEVKEEFSSDKPVLCAENGDKSLLKEIELGDTRPLVQGNTTDNKSPTSMPLPSSTNLKNRQRQLSVYSRVSTEKVSVSHKKMSATVDRSRKTVIPKRKVSPVRKSIHKNLSNKKASYATKSKEIISGLQSNKEEGIRKSKYYNDNSSINRALDRKSILSNRESTHMTFPKAPSLSTRSLNGERTDSLVGKVESHPGTSRLSTRRRLTIPKGPKLRTQSLHGDRSYSSIRKNEEKSDPTASVVSPRRSLTIPKGPKLRTQSLHGDRKYSSLGKREKINDHTSVSSTSSVTSPRRIATVPKGPNLRTQSLHGYRKYSSLGKREKKLDPATLFTSSLKKNPRVTSPRRIATVPKGPKLRTQSLHGDRKYSSIGKREKKLDPAKLFTSLSKKDPSLVTSPRRVTTLPKGPKLRTQSLHGDRKYSSLGKREEKKDSTTLFTSSSRRSLTVPKGPKLKTQSLHGDRKYSSLGKRDKTINPVAILSSSPRKDPSDSSPRRTATIPKAPKLMTQSLHGDRKYSSLGRREKLHTSALLTTSPSKTSGWTNRKLTVPKSPQLSSTRRRIRDRVEDDKENKENNKSFKAVPFRPGMRPPKQGAAGCIGIPKIEKKAPTIPKGFRLHSHERGVKGVSPQTREKSGKTTFRARPMPDLSYKPPTFTSSDLTTPNPFRLSNGEVKGMISNSSPPSLEKLAKYAKVSTNADNSKDASKLSQFPFIAPQQGSSHSGKEEITRQLVSAALSVTTSLSKTDTSSCSNVDNLIMPPEGVSKRRLTTPKPFNLLTKPKSPTKTPLTTEQRKLLDIRKAKFRARRMPKFSKPEINQASKLRNSASQLPVLSPRDIINKRQVNTKSRGEQMEKAKCLVKQAEQLSSTTPRPQISLQSASKKDDDLEAIHNVESPLSSLQTVS